MKYIEIVMALLMINLTIGLFGQTNLLRLNEVTDLRSDSPVDSEGNLLEQESMAYKIYNFNKEKVYLNSAQNLDQQYLQAGGDFLKGLSWFIEAFVKGTLLVNITLRNFGVPEGIIWYFAIPVYFMYVVAMIQLVSGRSFSGND